MFNIPDHPDVASALRTGYPRSYNRHEHSYDEDCEYENRRDELAEERRSYMMKQLRELERRDHEAHK